MTVSLPSELASREEIKTYQLQRLRRLLSHAYDNSSLYRRKFSEIGIKPEDIKTLDDISKLPLLTDELIREEVKRTGDPFAGLLCCPADMLQAISIPVVKDGGTLQGFRGSERIPWLYGYTRTDFDRVSAMLSRMWLALGAGFGSKFHMVHQWPDIWWNTVYPSLWRIGAIMYPGSKGIVMIEENVTVPRYLKPQFLCAPIHVVSGVIKRAKEMGLDPGVIFS